MHVVPKALFYFVLLFACWFGIQKYSDYGVSWDEYAQREIGLSSYNYVFKGDKSLYTFKDRDYGVAFELPLMIVEQTFMNEASLEEIYKFRHLVTHLFFLLALIVLGKLIHAHFHSYWYSLLGLLIVLFTPRLYGHSFFNTKDIPFLAGYIVGIYAWVRAFRSYKKRDFIILSVVLAVILNLRIMGIMLFVFTLVALWWDGKQNPAIKKQNRNLSLWVWLTTLGTLYVIWPYLWHNPYRFLPIFESMARFRWNGQVLFDGAMYAGKQIPFYYGPTWIFISTPLLFIALLFVGLIPYIKQVKENVMAFFENGEKRNELLYLACFGAPLIAVVVLGSTLYDGWRQLYFIYGGGVLVMLKGVEFIYKSLANKRFAFALIAAVFLVQCGVIAQYYSKNHPFEHVYFNELVNKSPNHIQKNWEMDYWGTSFRKGVAYLEQEYPEGNYNVAYNIFPAELNANVFLSEKDRQRFSFAQQLNDSTHIVLTNFRLEPQSRLDSLHTFFDLKHEIVTNNSTIMAVYQRKP